MVEAEIAKALDNVRVHNIEDKKRTVIAPHTPFKPFSARA